MCGLIGWLSRKEPEEVSDMVMEQYERQFSRGTRGFGLIELGEDSYRVRRATEPVKALLDISRAKSSMLLFHHRSPTSTDNTLEQTHPLFISHAELKHDYLFMHNGVIQNAVERYNYHTKELGYIYLTDTGETPTGGYYSKHFNDSEALAIDTIRVMEGLDDTIKSRGSAAFLAVSLDKVTGAPLDAFWGRNEGNDLLIGLYKNSIALASELDLGNDVKPFTLFWIPLKKIYGTKKSPGQFIKERPLLWEALPIVPPAATPSVYQWDRPGINSGRPTQEGISPALRQIGFVTAHNTATTTEEKAALAGGPEDELSIRERAVQLMQERDMEKISNAIWPVYEELAYAEVSGNYIETVINQIRGILLERAAKMVKPREWFDRQETEQAYAEKEAEEWAREAAALEDDGARHYSPAEEADTLLGNETRHEPRIDSVA